jgi:succinate dehydrogenase / fumarate reductase, membrane anchor subunit
VHLVKAYSKTPVGAHYGLGDWLLQRLTAVVMAVYTIVALAMVIAQAPSNHAEWRALFGGGFFRAFTMLFFLALLYHAWVGMRDILMDYVRATGLRLALQSVVGIVLLLYLIWSASILWGRP